MFTGLLQKRNVVAPLMIAAFLSGCATVAPPVRQVRATIEARHSPELNVVGKAEIGESIISKEYISRIRGISLAEAVSESVNPPGTTRVMAGDFELHSTGQDGDYYQGNADYSMLGQSVPSSDRAGVFVPKDKNRPAVIYHFALSYHYGVKPVAYIPKEIVHFTPESFRREIVYSGVSQNTVTFIYREFKDNLARPAFTQELKYDLSQGRVVGYKGARFEIVEAGNTSVTYKVLSLLE
ncbi:hypothetical protein ACO0LM_11360 [Undibacterium sp. Di26W]|uniref:hypothetical protein n=1 Tax=Undibacterium sp. Di26W TaxID=3413035 RepID=UPI003BF180F3